VGIKPSLRQDGRVVPPERQAGSNALTACSKAPSMPTRRRAIGLAPAGLSDRCLPERNTNWPDPAAHIPRFVGNRFS